jgi:NADH-quinone oxidoreductase subunit A
LREIEFPLYILDRKKSLYFMNFTLLVTVLLTAIIFVGLVITISHAISPRSYNPQKMEPYECGIPTRGRSWMQFRVGYYLFAILFLMFEVETVFLFPWAISVRQSGVSALLGVAFFLFILVLGLAYAWRKGALEWK